MGHTVELFTNQVWQKAEVMATRSGRRVGSNIVEQFLRLTNVNADAGPAAPQWLTSGWLTVDSECICALGTHLTAPPDFAHRSPFCRGEWKIPLNVSDQRRARWSRIKMKLLAMRAFRIPLARARSFQRPNNTVASVRGIMRSQSI